MMETATATATTATATATTATRDDGTMANLFLITIDVFLVARYLFLECFDWR
jgi:hypothetical protein